jgi:hypothetical protein
MATYAELYELGSNAALRNKMTVACLVAAQAVMVEAGTVENHANRLLWAKSVFSDPQGMGQKMLMAALAANAALTVAQITGAADAALLATVQGAINLFATGAI